ncbi:MAG: cell division protein SepF [archaeon]
MALLDKMFTKKEEVNIDEFLNNMDMMEEVHEDVDFYVKPINLQSNVDVETAIKELKLKNLILLDIENLSKRNPQRAKQFIGQIKMFAKDNSGDLALISKNKILIVPSKVKIIKKMD